PDRQQRREPGAQHQDPAGGAHPFGRHDGQQREREGNGRDAPHGAAMSEAPGPLRLKDLRPAEARAAARANPKLILPAGTTEHQGPHLPLGADTIVVERLADDLSAEFRVLRAPTIEYGVNDGLEKLFTGGASVRRKTLRRWVNDLLPNWEELGI